MVFTRNSKTAARVAEQFEKRQVSKTYWAMLENRPEADSGLLVDWLLKVPDLAISEVVTPATAGAKAARLEYQVLREVDGRWLVEVKLLTGRMHQIRIQFASRGCPVVGDMKYGAAPRLDSDKVVGACNENVLDGKKATTSAGELQPRRNASDIRNCACMLGRWESAASNSVRLANAGNTRP